MQNLCRAQSFLVIMGCISILLSGCKSTQPEPAPCATPTAQPSPEKPAEPPKPIQFYNAQFATDAEGWTLTPWKSSEQHELGRIGVSTTTGNPAGSIECSGIGQSNNRDTCTREGGEMSRVISTAGYKSIKLDYDFFFDTNKTGGACDGKCQVLEGDCADKLVVYYSTTGLEGPWLLLEKFDTASVPQSTIQHRTIDLADHNVIDNNPSFALRFKFQFNNTTDVGRLDNIQLTGMP